MKIKQVEELVGITSKNIRFYEDQGLINPGRADNGYREYDIEDVQTLKQIKLLRKLGISIDEIKAVFNGKITLNDCLEKGIDEIRKQQENLKQMEALAENLILSRKSITTLDSDFWLDEIEKMEKEGVEFMDVKKNDIHKKKKAGAIAGGVGMILVYAGMIVLFLWARQQDPGMPTGALIAFLAVMTLVIVGIAFALRSRLKEIDGGEEDEALKY